MAGNTFGKLFSITTFGESHGKAIGVVIDGCPAGLAIDQDFIQQQLNKRKPGQSKITTQRQESDQTEILSGIFEGKTTGTPIALLIPNQDQKSEDYTELKNVFRPSHADFTYQQKYGIRDHRGGGRSSARETAARVAAGAIAQLLLKHCCKDIYIRAYVSQVGNIKLQKPYQDLDLNTIDDNLVRCPDQNTAQQMIASIEKAKSQGDSLGGTITCVVKNMPIGLGEPVFNRLEANLAQAMLSINATKGFDIGSGFEGVSMPGSMHNDQMRADRLFLTNHSGGVQGGISNGEDIYFRVAFKPTATISQAQQTIDLAGNDTTLEAKGRHDPCVLPRAVAIVEAMTALVLADHLLQNRMARV